MRRKVNFSEALIEDYDQAVGKCEYSTFFHTTEWFQIWEKFEKKKFSVYSILINGKNIYIPLLIKRKQMPFISAENSPQGTYGGLISESILKEFEYYEVLEHLKRRFGKLSIKGNPYLNFSKYNNEFTQVIDLSITWEQIENGFKKSVKKRLKKAKNPILKIIPLEKRHLSDFYTLYQKRINEWSNPTNEYPYKIFEEIYNLDGSDFWGVEFNKKIILAGFVFRHKDKVVNWIGIGNSDYYKTNSFTYYYVKLMKAYKEKGFKYFDFNPSGGHEKVVDFKNSFGPEKIYFDHFEKSKFQYKISEKIYLKLLRLGVLQK